MLAPRAYNYLLDLTHSEARSRAVTDMVSISFRATLGCSIFIKFISSLHVPYNFSKIIPTIQVSNLVTNNPLTVQCDDRYGVDLDVLDCRNAISQFNSGPGYFTVGDRQRLPPGDEETLPLPYRLMGSKFFAGRTSRLNLLLE